MKKYAYLKSAPLVAALALGSSASATVFQYDTQFGGADTRLTIDTRAGTATYVGGGTNVVYSGADFSSFNGIDTNQVFEFTGVRGVVDNRGNILVPTTSATFGNPQLRFRNNGQSEIWSAAFNEDGRIVNFDIDSSPLIRVSPNSGSGANLGGAISSSSGGNVNSTSTGGVSTSTGGVSTSTGGASVSTSTGGVSTSTGGVSSSTGGVSTSTGGVSSSTGGVSTSTGGVSTSTGGVSTSTGGVSTSTGGVSTSTGGVSTGGVTSGGFVPSSTSTSTSTSTGGFTSTGGTSGGVGNSTGGFNDGSTGGTPVPAPGILGLIGLGLAGLMFGRRRKIRK